MATRRKEINFIMTNFSDETEGWLTKEIHIAQLKVYSVTALEGRWTQVKILYPSLTSMLF